MHVVLFSLLTYLLTYMSVQSPLSAKAKGDPAEAVRRRLENLENNMDGLRSKVDRTLETFRNAEQKRIRRQQAHNKLITTIAEVPVIMLHARSHRGA